jgi:hypothetical protein
MAASVFLGLFRRALEHGLGLAVGLRSWLRSRGLCAWGNGLVLGYWGIWIVAAWWLTQS